MTKSLPLFDDSGFVENPGALLFGFMVYPECERSARQFSQIIVQENQAWIAGSEYREGTLFRAVMGAVNMPLLTLVGEMALQLVEDHLNGKAYSKSKAAHVVHEMFAKRRTEDGGSYPREPRRLGRAFSQYSSVAHLWAAVGIARSDGRGGSSVGGRTINSMMLSREILAEVLVNSEMLSDVLTKASGDDCRWTALPGLARFYDPSRDYSVSTLEHPGISEALATYRARSGR
ncbi:hypothetical protein [Limimaricola cinnabarinus]|uniref:hypothetical protein n=1 Tax=Limimaricola cinnabarinus TaxID=1125964 RepID=UPI0013A65B3C|nr:hypothetical protein [Limimaricola cinnabarinus]